jgi:hypothetical protein
MATALALVYSTFLLFDAVHFREILSALEESCSLPSWHLTLWTSSHALTHVCTCHAPVTVVEWSFVESANITASICSTLFLVFLHKHREAIIAHGSVLASEFEGTMPTLVGPLDGLLQFWAGDLRGG